MTDQQENRLSRAGKVNSFLDKYKTDLAATPAITATLQPQLSAAISKMSSDDALATQDNTGYGDEKETDQTNLENMTDHIGSALESYADDADDFILMNAVEFTISQIQAFRDSRLLQYAKFVRDKANEAAIKPVLIAENNITQDDLNNLDSYIKTFEDIDPKPQQMKGEAVAWGKLVDRDLADIDKILDKIRRKMNTYRNTNRFLFDAFTAVDNVDDTGSHKSKEETIGANETISLATFVYAATTPFTLANTGTTQLRLVMYKNNVETGTPMLVASGNTASATLGDLASDGDELRLTNGSTTAGGYNFKM